MARLGRARPQRQLIVKKAVEVAVVAPLPQGQIVTNVNLISVP